MNPSFGQRGGAWVLGQAVLLGGVAFASIASQATIPVAGANLAGYALLVAGAGFGIAGTWVLGRGLTPFPRPPLRTRLVRSGIYAHVRHPLYTGVLLAAIGWALVWRSAWGLLISLMLIPFLVAKARREEQWLREEFPEYALYERRVPRFWPRAPWNSRSD
jgi:protein-S-isoprenylcysteine O-methyltransferase Ste14